MQFDVLIVGGGTAGSVLANRLSQDSKRKVLLLEAGPDLPHGKIPESLLDSYPGLAYIDRNYTWRELRVTTGLETHASASRSMNQKPYEQARVIGGGSTINGQLANRGSPEDYDGWEAAGAKGWAWKDVLPYFRKVERDMDFDGPLHGNAGRLPIRRIFPDLWSGHEKALAAALDAAGVPYLPDQNGVCEDGYFPLTISNAYERRVSASTAYLDPGTRLRANLTIVTNTQVSGLLFDGLRCVGVSAQHGDQAVQYRAAEVIIACGALHSPTLLLRAGIGPAAELKSHNINVVADRPGVGKNLTDHPSIAIASYLHPVARRNRLTRRHMVLGWRYSSQIGSPKHDMFAVASGQGAWHAVGKQIGSVLIIVNKTFSNSGEVTLRSTDWRDEPSVDFRLLSDARDLERLADGFHRVAALHAYPAVSHITSDIFPAVIGEKARQFGEPGHRNRLVTDLAARLLDGPAPLRRLIMSKFVAGPYRMDDLLRSPDALRAFIHDAVIGGWHAAGTCRMGAEDDPGAVTDSEGRVYGVSGLRVVDASIFPAIPRANINLPVLMVAEKIADALRSEQVSDSR